MMKRWQMLFAQWVIAAATTVVCGQPAVEKRTVLESPDFKEAIELKGRGRFQESAEKFKQLCDKAATQNKPIELQEASAGLARALAASALSINPELAKLQERKLPPTTEDVIAAFEEA